MKFNSALEYIEYVDSQSGESWSISNDTLADVMEDYAKMYHEMQVNKVASSQPIIESRLPEGFIKAQKRATAFKHDLKIILEKHRATIECEAEPHYGYIPNLDEIVVELDIIWNDNTTEIVAESATVNLGRNVYSDSL